MSNLKEDMSEMRRGAILGAVVTGFALTVAGAVLMALGEAWGVILLTIGFIALGLGGVMFYKLRHPSDRPGRG